MWWIPATSRLHYKLCTWLPCICPPSQSSFLCGRQTSTRKGVWGSMEMRRNMGTKMKPTIISGCTSSGNWPMIYGLSFPAHDYCPQSLHVNTEIEKLRTPTHWNMANNTVGGWLWQCSSSRSSSATNSLVRTLRCHSSPSGP